MRCPTLGSRLPDRRDALHPGGSRRFEILVGEDTKPHRSDIEEFAASQEKPWVAGPPIAFVSVGEGFVNQHAPGGDGGGQNGHQGPVEIVGHDHRIEGARTKWPRAAVLEIAPHKFEAPAVLVGQGPGISVDSGDAAALLEEVAEMPSTSARDIEYPVGRSKTGAIPNDPRRREACRPSGLVWVVACHVLRGPDAAKWSRMLESVDRVEPV